MKEFVPADKLGNIVHIQGNIDPWGLKTMFVNIRVALVVRGKFVLK
jgi:hypothetical protein